MPVTTRAPRLALLIGAAMLASLPALAQQASRAEPLTIEDQGSFAVGGTVVRTPGTYDNDKPTAAGSR